MTNWELSKPIIEKHGAITLEVPKSILKWLKEAAVRAKKNSKYANKDLIGHIKEEYYYTERSDKFEEFLYKKCLSQKNILNYTNSLKILFKSAPFRLSDMWVNFQKKHEFNPPHKHSGIYSFVIYLKIPFDLEKEESLYPTLNNEGQNHTSKFAFLNTNTLGRIFVQCLNVDKSFEGKIIMFPAEQLHTVFPFYTSADYRISVSGNIRLYNEN
tara:strand:- start:2018 stop:2656 length:639 start_codon:yes stop_codon:yes gene_type:complete